MKKFLMSAVAAVTMCGTAAIAADMPVKAPRPAPAPVSPWDWAFGGALMSDYNFRGISQSNRGPSVTAYSETRYNVNSSVQFYLAGQYWAVTLPTNPTAEVDIFGGVRFTAGSFGLDIGGMYYWYPREKQHNDVFFAVGQAPFPTYPNGNATLRQTDFWEVYGKATYEVVKDRFAVGANVYYSPSWLNTGASGLYASGTAKVTLPYFRLNVGMVDEVGWYCRVSSATTGSGQQMPIPASSRLPTASPRLCDLERRLRLHLEGRDPRPALLRHQPVEGELQRSDRRPECDHLGWCRSDRSGAAQRSSRL